MRVVTCIRVICCGIGRGIGLGRIGIRCIDCCGIVITCVPGTSCDTPSCDTPYV